MGYRGIALAALCWTSLQSQAQGSLRQFRDAPTDVSFSYPAEWKPGSSIGDFIPASILSPQVGGAVVKVGLAGGIRNTNLTSVEFVFVYTLTADADSCYALGEVPDGPSTGKPVAINGKAFRMTVGGEGATGHSIDETVLAHYEQGRCYLFDEAIGSVSANIEDWAKPVSKARYAAIKRQLAAAMQTVAIGPGFTPLVKYEDSTEPVRMLYPAAWKSEDGPADMAVDGAKARLHVGFGRGTGLPQAFVGTALDGLDFSYMALPATTTEACYALIRKLGGDKGNELKVDDQDYLRVHGETAATGHEIEFTMYASDPTGRVCYLFETAIYSSHGDASRRALTDAERALLRAQLYRVVGSIGIDWTQPKK